MVKHKHGFFKNYQRLEHHYQNEDVDPDDMEISNILPVNHNAWHSSQTKRLYDRIQQLKISRAERAIDSFAATATNMNSTMPINPVVYYGRPDTPSEFMSNQPVPMLMHLSTCSRRAYRQQPQSKFVFETYVNYEPDTFYFNDTNDPEDFQRLAYFFKCEDAKPILKVVLRHWLFENMDDMISEKNNQSFDRDGCCI
ncbi:hypothetical protein WAI453_010569 [Rhynchosporium graminicola]